MFNSGIATLPGGRCYTRRDFFRLVEISAVGRLKFVLFAAALPVLAYLHYSNAEKNEEIQQEESQQAEDEDKDFEQEDPENRIE